MEHVHIHSTEMNQDYIMPNRLQESSTTLFLTSAISDLTVNITDIGDHINVGHLFMCVGIDKTRAKLCKFHIIGNHH